MDLFPSSALVQRIEQAEARGLSALVEACGEGVVTHPVGGGVALYREPGSPFNKVAGLGFAPIAAAELVVVEQLFDARGVPTQIEMSTQAPGEWGKLLGARGYVLTGYENVLGRAVGARVAQGSQALKRIAPNLTVERAADSEQDREAWIFALTEGFSAREVGEDAPEHDDFDRSALDRVFRDMADKPTVARWLALYNGAVVGAASMGVCDGVAQFFGAAVVPSARRRGVHSALLATRLAYALEQGCELAVVTTQPGSKSHQNALRTGFQLLYARAIWVRNAGGA